MNKSEIKKEIQNYESIELWGDLSSTQMALLEAYRDDLKRLEDEDRQT